jgi:plastocyanin
MTRAAIVVLAAGLAACSSSAPKVEPKPEPKSEPVARGSMSGKVTFTGKHPTAKRVDISEDEECVKLNKRGLYDDSLLVNKDGSLANVFVYIKAGLKGETGSIPAQSVVLDQKGCQFSPRVLAVRTRQTIKVTNSDPVTHNVHPVAQKNREWNQSQAPGDPPIERRFGYPEVLIRVKCNVHNWMRSWVAVMDHPYFAITKADGTFEIPDVPAGDYTIEAWQEVLGTQQQQVHIDAMGKATLAFNFKAESTSK